MILPQVGLLFAVADGLFVFALVGLIAFKIAALTRDLTARDIDRLARIDVWSGALVAAALSVGLSRALLTDAGLVRCAGSVFYWARLAALVVVGLLSIAPAIAINRWRRDVRKFATSTPCIEDVRLARRFLWLEAVVLAPVVVFAALACGCGFATR